MPVDRSKFPILVCPLVPDVHILLLQSAHVGVTAQKPQQLDDNAMHKHPLGGQQREAIVQIKAHLMPEHSVCARACTVIAQYAVVPNTMQ